MAYNWNHNFLDLGGPTGTCCSVCAASASCVAATWDGHNCVFKSSEDLKHKVSAKNIHRLCFGIYRDSSSLKSNAWEQVPSASTTTLIPQVSSRQLNFKGTVPGDLVTDMQRAGVVPDPLHGRNYANASAWAGDEWVYSTTVQLPAVFATAGSTTLVVFDGIKVCLPHQLHYSYSVLYVILIHCSGLDGR